MTERHLQDNIVRLAKLLGWLCYHTHDSRKSTAGFPDLVLVRQYRQPGRALFAELKTERGRLSPAQETWCHALGAHIWRPSDWLDGTIERVLRGA